MLRFRESEFLFLAESVRNQDTKIRLANNSEDMWRFFIAKNVFIRSMSAEKMIEANLVVTH